jgi:hypothetical protein
MDLNSFHILHIVQPRNRSFIQVLPLFLLLPLLPLLLLPPPPLPLLLLLLLLDLLLKPPYFNPELDSIPFQSRSSTYLFQCGPIMLISGPVIPIISLLHTTAKSRNGEILFEIGNENRNEDGTANNLTIHYTWKPGIN